MEMGIQFQHSPWQVDSEIKHRSSICSRNYELCYKKGCLIPTFLINISMGCPRTGPSGVYFTISLSITFSKRTLVMPGMTGNPRRNEHNRTSPPDCLTCRQWRPSFIQAEYHATNPCFSYINSLSPRMLWRSMLSYFSACTFSSCRGH